MVLNQLTNCFLLKIFSEKCYKKMVKFLSKGREVMEFSLPHLPFILFIFYLLIDCLDIERLGESERQRGERH